MASQIILKKSSITARVPVVGDLAYGELALNYADGLLYYKKSDGTTIGTIGSVTPSLTITGGTANGVAYLNGSKVLTTGSALTFDGSVLSSVGTSPFKAVYVTTPSQYTTLNYDGLSVRGAQSAYYTVDTGYSQVWYVGVSESMRLTSTGLGIGTSSPGDKIHAAAGVAAGLSLQATGTGGSTWRILSTDNSASLGGGYLGFNNGSYRMVLDASGNLGIGTTTPSAKLEVNGVTKLLSGGTGGLYGSDNSSYFLFQASTTANAAAIYLNGQARSGFASHIQYAGAQHVWFNETVGVERMRITAAGAIAFNGASNYGSAGQVLQSNGDAPPTWVNSAASGSYLPLSGGTLTGTLVINADNGVSAIYGSTDGQTWLRGWGIESNRTNTYLRPTSNNTQTLHIGSTPNTLSWYTIRLDATNVLVNDSQVLHAGNYTSYAPAFDSLTSKTGGTGDYMTTGSFIAQNILRVQNGTADWDSLDLNADGATHYINARGAETGLSFQFDGTDRMVLANSGALTLMSGALRQGNNMARPLAEWSASGSATGMVFFELPGDTSNYGMVHMVFDIYEYNGNNAATVIIGGHNWNASWYEKGVNVIGQTDKQVRLGVRGGKYVVCFGTATSTWSYGTVSFRKIHNGSFYNGAMNMTGPFTANITTSENLTNDSGDLRSLRTPGTFNAGGAITQAGNQVLHAGNYNSYSPTLTGGSASGTWGINITGSAATANIANSADYSTTSLVQDTRAAQLLPNQYTGHRTTYEFTNQIVAGGDWHSAITTVGWDSASYAAWQILGGATSSTHENWYLRSGIGSSWNSLRTILHAGNYNSYSPTLTGGSASGTWGINITGSAATATDSTKVAKTGDTMTGALNISVAPSGRSLSLGGDQLDRVIDDSARAGLVINATYYPHLYINATTNNGNTNHGAVFSMTGNLTAGGYRRWGMGIANTDPDCFSWGYYDNNVNPHYGVGGTFGYTGTYAKMWLNTDGSLMTTGDMRAPIFYDSNNTNYFVDPASNSFISSLSVNVGQESTGAANSSSAGLVLRGNYNSNTWAHKFHKFDNGNGVPMYLSYTAGTGAWTAAQGWGPGLTYTSQVFGSFRADGIYSNIFYDADNTGYYLDAAGTSSLNRISTVRTDNFLYMDNNYGHSIVGAYSANRYQGVFAMGDAYKLPADGTTTGSLYGLAWSHPNAGGTAANLNTHGLLVLENGAFLAAVSGSIRARDDMRAPIFYDSNDTAYYGNFASTSNLYDLHITGAAHKYLYINPGNGYEAMVRYNGGSGSGWYVGKRTTGQTVSTNDFHFYSEAAGKTVAGIDTSGNMVLTGSLSAITKSFLIDHPTKPGMKLRYGSLEGPENGVYIRGKLRGNKIELPEYWTKLVDPDSITVNLTAIGKSQNLYVEDIKDNTVYVGGENVNCFYTVYAERVDVAKLEVEVA